MRRMMSPFLIAMTALGLATWSLAETVRHPGQAGVIDPAIADTTLAVSELDRGQRSDALPPAASSAQTMNARGR